MGKGTAKQTLIIIGIHVLFDKECSTCSNGRNGEHKKKSCKVAQATITPRREGQNVTKREKSSEEIEQTHNQTKQKRSIHRASDNHTN